MKGNEYEKVLPVFLALCLAAGAMGCDGKTGKEDSEEEPAVESAANESTAGESKAGSADFGDLKIKCEEGTDECWTLEGSTLTFAGLTANTVVSISGSFDGAIVVDAGDDFEFELELRGARLSCGTQSPITVLSGDKFTLTAKKDTENYICDTRDAVPEDDENAYSAAVYVKCDMTLGGKGSLTVESSHNNGIHTKDDLKVKNLTLTVTCEDNALKGNDSVEIESGILTLIARTGDGIKTSSSDVSKKGKQRGTVTITGGNSSIDTESGYAYNGGSVLALCPSNGMSSEATKCRNFSSVGTKGSVSLTSGQTLTVTVGGEEATSVKMPCKLNALVIYLGSSKAEFEKK